MRSQHGDHTPARTPDQCFGRGRTEAAGAKSLHHHPGGCRRPPAEPQYHGGVDRAVCLYSLEVIEALQAEGHGVAPGSCGENLTLAGLDWAQLKPGDRLRIGPDVRLKVTNYTVPCSQQTQWFKDGNFTRISQKKHPGWSRLYARVLAEGLVRPGDTVAVEEGNGAGA